MAAKDRPFRKWAVSVLNDVTDAKRLDRQNRNSARESYDRPADADPEVAILRRELVKLSREDLADHGRYDRRRQRAQWIFGRLRELSGKRAA